MLCYTLEDFFLAVGEYPQAIASEISMPCHRSETYVYYTRTIHSGALSSIICYAKGQKQTQDTVMRLFANPNPNLKPVITYRDRHITD